MFCSIMRRSQSHHFTNFLGKFLSFMTICKRPITCLMTVLPNEIYDVASSNEGRRTACICSSDAFTFDIYSLINALFSITGHKNIATTERVVLRKHVNSGKHVTYLFMSHTFLCHLLICHTFSCLTCSYNLSPAPWSLALLSRAFPSHNDSKLEMRRRALFY